LESARSVHAILRELVRDCRLDGLGGYDVSIASGLIAVFLLGNASAVEIARQFGIDL
jgi:hypothetical protein